MNGDPPAAQASTPRRGRLTKAAEFDAVTQLGRSVGGRYLTLRYRAAEGGSQARIGYAVPRKVGGAVDRNLVKRRLREAIAHHEQLLMPATESLGDAGGLAVLVVGGALAYVAATLAFARSIVGPMWGGLRGVGA